MTNPLIDNNVVDNRKPAVMKFVIDKSPMPSDRKERVGWTPHATIKFKRYTIGFVSNGAVYLRLYIRDVSRRAATGCEWENVQLVLPRMNFDQACEHVVDNSEDIFYKYDLMAKQEIDRDGGFIKPTIVEYL